MARPVRRAQARDVIAIRVAMFLLALAVTPVAPALAATYYVSTSGSDASSGTSAGSAWRTVAKANSSLRPGDIVYLLPGTYGDAINPVNSGTPDLRITYFGDINTPTLAIVGAITLSNDDYITIKGVTATGELACDADSRGASSDGDSVVSCVIQGGITTAGAWNCVFARNTIGTPGSTTSKWLITANPQGLDASGNLMPPAAITYGCTYEDNVMYLGSASGNNCVSLAHNRNCRFLRNQVQLYLPSGSVATGFIAYRIKDNLFSGNRWTLSNSAGADKYLLCMRDSTRFNVFDGDVFEDDPAASNSGIMYFSASGTFPHSVGYNTWKDCRMHVRGAMRYQDHGGGDTFANNVVIAHTAFSAQGDSLTFQHNTFFVNGSLAIDVESGAPLYSSTWRSNIFYTTSAGVHSYIRDAGTPKIDYNLYYCPAEDSTNATYQGRVGAGTSWCTSAGNDCHSHWGNPRFLSTDPRNYDLRLGALSIGLSASLWPDGYVGARVDGSGASDTVPPAPITDLRTGP